MPSSRVSLCLSPTSGCYTKTAKRRITLTTKQRILVFCFQIKFERNHPQRGRQIQHTHTHLTALFPGLPRWAGTRKVKPIWILLKQETVSGSGISWTICKSAPCCRQTTTSAPHHSVFTGRMPFLPPNQQRQSTEGTARYNRDRWKSATFNNYLDISRKR